MKVRKFSLSNASMERSPGQAGDIYTGDLVNAHDGGPITVGYGRWEPFQSLEDIMAVDDVMIILEGALSVTTEDGVLPASVGDIVHMPKGSKVKIRTEGEGATTAYVTYPHWRTA